MRDLQPTRQIIAEPSQLSPAVYQALQELVEQGIVEEIRGLDGKVRYSRGSNWMEGGES